MWLFVAILPAFAGKQPSKRPTDEARGLELYERHCQACHGKTAQGDGPAAKALAEPVAAITETFDVTTKLIDLVMLGQNRMPAFAETFDRGDAKRVLVHMATLPEKAKTAEPEAPADPVE